MLRLYNTLTRQEEAFAPARGNTVRMYACGLTVYARGHIGNFRTFVCVDVLRRTLKYLCGHEVDGVMNYTDVDDKTIAGASKAGKPLREYTEEWVNAFRVRCRPAGHRDARTHAARDRRCRTCRRCATWSSRSSRTGTPTAVTDRSTSGSRRCRPTGVWLGSISRASMPARALTSTNTPRTMRGTSCCGRRAKPGEPTWDCAGLPGRPGWHIECSAMALRLLDGPPIDIHAGGVDLIFPHHENEIAQAEGATKQTFSRFWVHVEHLFVENEKMSKSLGNVYTVPDIVAKGFRPSALRYLLLSSHYRKQLNFTWSGMEQAEESLRRVVDFLVRLEGVTGRGNFRRRRGRCRRRRATRSRRRSKATSIPRQGWRRSSISSRAATRRSMPER